MADALALEPQAAPPGTYRQRGVNSLQRLFRAHFTEFFVRYEAELAMRLGKFRLAQITRAGERFLGCGDYSKGIAESSAPTPTAECEYFRPFSCSVFHLCPSCCGSCTGSSCSLSLREVTGKNTNIVCHEINPVKKKSW